MIFFAEVKLSNFLISSGSTFQSLVDEPIKLFLELVEEPNSIKSPLVMLLVPIPIPSSVSDFCSTLSERQLKVITVYHLCKNHLLRFLILFKRGLNSLPFLSQLVLSKSFDLLSST
jgi:hypothetical protein